MPVMLWQVDAFTDRPFAGNPAAVCLLDREVDPAWMQAVAAEMNLSETAFATPRGASFGLRWFTPAVEVDLCGHATLATAHVLWESGVLDPRQEAAFSTRSGALTVRRLPDGWMEMDFPALPAKEAAPPAGLLEALGVEARYVGRSRFDVLVEAADAAAVRGLAPDFSRLARLECRGVMVTAPSDVAGADFVSRFFAPAVGVNEDPVTGSAHCVLTPHWAAKLGKDRLDALQVSARGGRLRLALAGDRVKIAGQAVTVLRGELC
ncbi:MAG: PhzF family phenazine biosynthesis protein [Thermodesulfobacteriota bacterium]